MELNELADNKGARHRKMIIGRGIGSGKGKTCGRGYKGQKARTGVRINGFEGGQMPLHRRLPKRGFKNYTRIEYAVINLSDLQRALDSKTLDGDSVNIESLSAAGLIKASTKRLKLLGNGTVSSRFTIAVHKASKSAVDAIEKAGGSVSLLGDGKSASA